MIVYNEIEPYAAEWLKNLIAAGHIAPGRVDRRSIADLRVEDVSAQHQAHFFAGIGVWSHALRLAGWPDDLPVWTGSCPCQPFSAAGRKKGTNDARHLWPEWFRLIRQCRPAVVLGEQVASPLGLAWFDSVRADLEGEGYAVAAADLCAAGVGAPHIRQRLYFVAVADGQRRQELGVHLRQRTARQALSQAPGRGAVGHQQLDLFGGAQADAYGSARRQGRANRARSASGTSTVDDGSGLGDDSTARILGDAGSSRLEEWTGEPSDDDAQREAPERAGREPGPVGGFWAGADWIACKDGRTRPVEPGPQQMADGFAESMGRVRADTISKIQAEVIRAGITENDAREALQVLWSALAEETVQRSSGRCRSLHEAPVLLTFLRELAREGWHLLDNVPSTCWEDAAAGLRELRQSTPSTSCTSPGRGHLEQYSVKLAHALSILSQAITSALEECWVIPHPLAYGAPSSVGRLRAYGNAIVGPLAAAFIESVIELL
jgi:site-specific DNA-cytosine methylase